MQLVSCEAGAPGPLTSFVRRVAVQLWRRHGIHGRFVAPKGLGFWVPAFGPGGLETPGPGHFVSAQSVGLVRSRGGFVPVLVPGGGWVEVTVSDQGAVVENQLPGAWLPPQSSAATLVSQSTPPNYAVMVHEPDPMPQAVRWMGDDVSDEHLSIVEKGTGLRDVLNTAIETAPGPVEGGSSSSSPAFAPPPRLTVTLPTATVTAEVLSSVWWMYQSIPRDQRAGWRVMVAGDLYPGAVSFAAHISIVTGGEVKVVAAPDRSARAMIAVSAASGRVSLDLAGGVKHVFDLLPYGQHADTWVEVVGSLAPEASEKLEGLSQTYGFGLTRWQGPESSPDASRWIERHLVYVQKAAEFERALAPYLAGRPDVNEQVRVLVEAVWSRTTSDEQRRRFGTTDPRVAGMVGTDPQVLRRVVESGNLRERLALLYFGLTSKENSLMIAEMLGVQLKRSPQIQAERKHRTDSTYARDRLANVEQEVKARTDLDAAAKSHLIYQKTEELMLTGDHPDAVYPPLSQDERNAVVDDRGRLRWAPAENYYGVGMSSGLQLQAQMTGGLVMTGTSSGGSFVLVQAVKEMQRRWGVQVDLGLLRLALLAWEIPTRNHTFHELMRGAQLGDSTLTYRDSWDRYRHLAPLSEQELRQHVAPDGMFPEEHAWEQVPLDLDEREPAASQFAHLPTVDPPTYLVLDAAAGKDPKQVVSDRLRGPAVLVTSVTVPNPAPGQVVVEFATGLGKDVSSLPGAEPGQAVVLRKRLRIGSARVEADTAAGRGVAWVTVSSSNGAGGTERPSFVPSHAHQPGEINATKPQSALTAIATLFTEAGGALPAVIGPGGRVRVGAFELVVGGISAHPGRTRCLRGVSRVLRSGCTGIPAPPRSWSWSTMPRG